MQTDSGDPSSVSNVQQRYENLFFLKEVCARFLKEPILRLPFLLTAIHHDNVEFPDADVVDLFTNPFPDLHIIAGTRHEWGHTASGRGDADKDYIAASSSCGLRL